jgi:hypothetical protein
MHIEDPDVEQVLIDWAGPALAGQGVTVPVAIELAGKECVAIYRVGGVRRNLVVDSPTLIFEAKAGTSARAFLIIRKLRSLAHELPAAGIGVNHVEELAGPALLPREDAPNRYTMTLSIDFESDIT